MTNVEEKMGEFAATINDLIYAHNKHENYITWIKSKIADLEDRSRCRNVKIRGIPNAVKQPEIKAYFTERMNVALPDTPLEDLTVDHIHRLPKPKHITVHRDTIACIHFCQTKENLMSALRRVDQLPECLLAFSNFVDLSGHIMQ